MQFLLKRIHLLQLFFRPHKLGTQSIDFCPQYPASILNLLTFTLLITKLMLNPVFLRLDLLEKHLGLTIT